MTNIAIWQPDAPDQVSTIECSSKNSWSRVVDNMLTNSAAASKVSPTQGSIAGGNHLTITGKGMQVLQPCI